ncbi:MAG: hypothetical protein GYB64_18355 [Chloroflexi bacterium]|nr:hypothetical protein [Chloroflexota bacterium]
MQDLRRAIPILLAALVAAVGLSLFALRQARPAQIRYFPETDATVREPFLSAFEAAGGVDVLGLPLTDAYQDENGSLIQPFERMVFAQTVRGVAPSPVGTALSLGTAGETAGVDPAFAEAYATLGGQDFFGLALSPARQEANFLVQDFATARLLRCPVGSVGLAPLGRA